MILQATFGASKMRSRPFARAEPIKLLYSTLPKRQFNALQDYVVDFAPFPEGGFPKALVNSQGQVNGCMDDSGPWLAAAGLSIECGCDSRGTAFRDVGRRRFDPGVLGEWRGRGK